MLNAITNGLLNSLGTPTAVTPVKRVCNARVKPIHAQKQSTRKTQLQQALKAGQK